MDAQAGPLVKQMKQLGMTPIFMGADGINTPEFAKLAGADAEGSYASSAGADKAIMPGYRRLQPEFVKRFNAQIQAYAPYTYDATRVLIEAMKRAQSAPTRAKCCRTAEDPVPRRDRQHRLYPQGRHC